MAKFLDLDVFLDGYAFVGVHVTGELYFLNSHTLLAHFLQPPLILLHTLLEFPNLHTLINTLHVILDPFHGHVFLPHRSQALLLFLDSHVLLQGNTLIRLIDFAYGLLGSLDVTLLQALDVFNSHAL